MRWSFWSSFLLVCALPCSVLAQTAPVVAGGTVTGHVICSDTHGPARFAKVLLRPTTPEHEGNDFLKQMEEAASKARAKRGEAPVVDTPEKARQKAGAAANLNLVTEMLGAATVGIDGAYQMTALKPGTYYVHVLLEGYVDPLAGLTDEDFASSDPAMKARIAQIPTVTVNGTDAVRLDLKIERGAALSGRVTFDDGTPAVGWMVKAVGAESAAGVIDPQGIAMDKALAMDGLGGGSRTDDQGRYRVSGLAAGSYVLRAAMAAQGFGASARSLRGSGIVLTVYSGGTFARKGAAALKVTAGEEQVGVDLSVPVRRLHTVAGRVTAKADGHALNRGNVELTAKSNPAVELKATIREDGSFRFEDLPGGVTYTLKVEDAEDTRSTPSKGGFMGISIPNVEVLHRYEAGTQEVALGEADVDTVWFSLGMTDWVPPVAKPKPTGAKQEDLFDERDE